MFSLSREVKQQCIEDIQTYFAIERGEEIGFLGAEGLYDLFLKQLAPHVYNEGVKDAQSLMISMFANIEDELYVLLKQPEK
ncbi:DUF2164 domain-containing protein [Bacillus sp. HMF5848]|uniref:DUF2164 domain-containing protein n=1 Tax=Bacillus sp. HMF5848 TaxID=2495421 RepID=UPI000F76CF58|nr:DUF2164 domain-containing protein [Bacillus sp. HMF5848]RSK28159.1 DUF2164 domain-containing protein [Bacillus sp. HMF5848]